MNLNGMTQFPESAEETETPFGNIIHHSFPARYECISIIKCITELEKIEASFKQYLEQINEPSE